MYLKIKNEANTKQYTLTNSYAKPYIKVSNSILPLTTNTTNGLQLKVKISNQTYRPLEYSSSSESGTFFTTSAQSAGLSSVTALTRESISGYSYLTRESTSGESYLTQTRNQKATIISTYVDDSKRTSYTYVFDNVTNFATATYSTNYTYSCSRTEFAVTGNYTIAVNNSLATVSYSNQPFYLSFYTPVGGEWNLHAYYQAVTWHIYQAESLSNADSITGLNVYNARGSTWNLATTNNIYWDVTHAFTYDTKTSEVTGTSYLTRESTYSTITLTRSSTSGYSGVSSSSYSTTAWR